MTICPECERLSVMQTTAYPQLCWHHQCLRVAMYYLVASLIYPKVQP